MKLLKKLVLSVLRISFLLVCVNVGCSLFVPSGIHKDTRKYVEIFKHDMGISEEDLEGVDIGFYSLKYIPVVTLSYPYFGGNVLGVCLLLSDTIIFDPDHWKNRTERKKTSLIFHELGHCYCNKMGHRDGVRADGCHKSIMHPNETSNHCLKKHWLDYVKEFKENC